MDIRSTYSKIRPRLEAAFADYEGQPLDVIIGIRVAPAELGGLTEALGTDSLRLIDEHFLKSVQRVLDYLTAQGYDLDFVTVREGSSLRSGQPLSYTIVQELAEKDDVLYVEWDSK